MLAQRWIEPTLHSSVPCPSTIGWQYDCVAMSLHSMKYIMIFHNHTQEFNAEEHKERIWVCPCIALRCDEHQCEGGTMQCGALIGLYCERGIFSAAEHWSDNQLTWSLQCSRTETHLRHSMSQYVIMTISHSIVTPWYLWDMENKFLMRSVADPLSLVKPRLT